MSGGESGAERREREAADRATEDRARKAEATARINRLFGHEEGVGDRPLERDYQAQQYWSYAGEGGPTNAPPVFSPEAFNRDLAAWEAKHAEAAANRAARENQYGETHAAGFDLNKTKLDTDREESSRLLKFALARSGLFGGSTDVDQRALEQRTYNRGLLDIGNMADTQVADLKSRDEQARLGLLSGINAGMDAGSALSSAREQLSLNAERANAAARSNIISNIFQNIGLLYDRQNQVAGINDARGRYPNFGAFFPTAGSSGTVVNQAGW